MWGSRPRAVAAEGGLRIPGYGGRVQGTHSGPAWPGAEGQGPQRRHLPRRPSFRNTGGLLEEEPSRAPMGLEVRAGARKPGVRVVLGWGVVWARGGQTNAMGVSPRFLMRLGRSVFYGGGSSGGLGRALRVRTDRCGCGMFWATDLGAEPSCCPPLELRAHQLQCCGW